MVLDLALAPRSGVLDMRGYRDEAEAPQLRPTQRESSYNRRAIASGSARMSQGWTEILYSVEDRVATITLNRPEKLNAWTVVMAGELREALAKAEATTACGRS